MTSHTYHHLAGRMLQHWHTIRIENDGETKRVFFTSRIHVNRELEVTHCYSSQFTDQQILNDHSLLTWAIDRYGADVTYGERLDG